MKSFVPPSPSPALRMSHVLFRGAFVTAQWGFSFLHVLQKHPSTASCKPGHARTFYSLSATFRGAHGLAHNTRAPMARLCFGVAMLHKTAKTAVKVTVLRPQQGSKLEPAEFAVQKTKEKPFAV